MIELIKESLLSEDIDDDSDSIFADDPLDEVEDKQTNEGYHKDKRPGDVQVGVAKDGKPLYGRRVGQTLEPEKHSLDKVTYSKSGKPIIGTSPVDFDYDEEDNLIATNSKEKELATDIAYYNSEIKRHDKDLAELRNRLRSAKRDLEKPYVNHYEVKEKIDNLFNQIKQIEDRKVNKRILVNALTKKYNEIYKRNKTEVKMRFNRNLDWLKEDNQSNELLNDDELDMVEEELNEGLYVDPSNYGNYTDLVDVVDNQGNPQKMTQQTYANNKGSKEFTVKEPEDKEKPQEQPKDKESKQEISTTDKGKEAVRNIQKKAFNSIVKDVARSHGNLRQVMKKLFSSNNLNDIYITQGLSKDEITDFVDSCPYFEDDEKPKMVQKILKQNKELGLDKPINTEDTIQEIALISDFKNAYGLGSYRVKDLLPEKMEKWEKGFKEPSERNWDFNRSIEELANKGKLYQDLEKTVGGLLKEGYIDKNTHDQLQSNLDKLAKMSSDNIEGIKQADADRKKQKEIELDSKRADFRNKEYQGSDNVKKALDRVLNPSENDLYDNYVKLQNDISNAVKQERRSGKPGSERQYINSLRSSQHKIAQDIASNLKDSNKEDIKLFFDQYFDKSGLDQSHKNNFAYQIGSRELDDGKTLAEHLGMDIFDFSDEFGAPYQPERY